MTTVELGDFPALWEAITQTGAFDICYNGSCITAPGWGSWAALILVCAETLFWGLIVIYGIRKLRKKKESKRTEPPFPPKVEQRAS